MWGCRLCGGQQEASYKFIFKFLLKEKRLFIFYTTKEFSVAQIYKDLFSVFRLCKNNMEFWDPKGLDCSSSYNGIWWEWLQKSPDLSGSAWLRKWGENIVNVPCLLKFCHLILGISISIHVSRLLIHLTKVNIDNFI